ncbi:MAG: phytanoyl-CoA dioxygenase family protein [Candidatus Dormibacteraceae bacterium]
MRSAVTDGEIQSYRERGFVVVPDLLDPAELDRWRKSADHAVSARASLSVPGHASADDPKAFAQLSEEQQQAARYYQKIFTQRVNLWQTDEGVRSLMFEQDLPRLAADLAGVDGLRIWHDQALIKGPYGNPTSFHLDNPYWSFHSADAISVWVALDDATLENGCLCYVAGSHLPPLYDNVNIGPEIGAIFGVHPEWKKLPIVHCPVPAGGAVFHNGLVCHGAGANLTHGYRRAMTCAYMPDGSTFNGLQNVLTDEQVARLRIGDVLSDEAQNPLVFSRRLT